MKNVSVSMGSITEGGGGGYCGRGGCRGPGMGRLSLQGAEVALIGEGGWAAEGRRVLFISTSLYVTNQPNFL